MDKLIKTIEKAKQELERMIDLNPQIMMLVTHDGVIVRTNRALLTLLSMSDFGEVLESRFEEVFRFSEDPLSLDLMALQKEEEPAESEVVVPGGRKLVLKFSVVGFGRESDLFVVIIEDVTGAKEHAADLEKKHKKEAVQEIVGALMHTINQWLTVIMMRVQLQQLAVEKGTVSPDELRDSLQEILRLSMKIADTLETAKRPGDYVTEVYHDNVNILDISKSAEDMDVNSSISQRLETLMLILDVHVPGTAVHALRIGEYSAFMAKHMGLDDENVAVVRRCGVLHDIGKIEVPAELLQKDGPITDEEMDVIRRHSEKGRSFLERCSFTAEAEVASAHHEWYDGSGYPRGLAGKDIPLHARIVSVADAFDVLRFGRSYCKSVSLDEAVKEIADKAGTQFDPEVVEIFRACAEDLDKVVDAVTFV